jgi:3-oxoacyl-[acyl-carrier protein] reductase
MKFLVTGTSSGLGFELANQLTFYGEVIGISRQMKTANKLSKNKQFTHIVADLSNFNVASKGSELINSLYAKINNEEFTLIINAAKFYAGKERLNSKEREKLFHLNIFSVMDLVESLRNCKLKRILFINSISGLIGQAYQHEYSASKHALMGFVRSLIKEAKHLPFDVMSINPGGINTELWEDYPDVTTKSFIPPAELAKIIITILLTKHRLFIENMVILPESDI